MVVDDWQGINGHGIGIVYRNVPISALRRMISSVTNCRGYDYVLSKGVILYLFVINSTKSIDNYGFLELLQVYLNSALHLTIFVD